MRMASPEEESKGGFSQPPDGHKSGGKRKTLGRSARRRKAKLRAIQEAEAAMWKQHDCTEGATRTAEKDMIQSSQQLPSDRDKVWPGVLERRRKGFALGQSEQVALFSQLGYLPGNAVAIISARASCMPSLLPLLLDENVPIVLQLYPLAIRDVFAGGKADGRKFKGRRRGGRPIASSHTNEIPVVHGVEGDGDKMEITTTESSIAPSNLEKNQNELPTVLEPFPTLYWLTHPMLRTLISKLELSTTNNVRVMEKRLRSDPTALASMKRAHQAYGKERWELLTPSDCELVTARGWQTDALCPEKRGVAGIRKHDCIKCLHAHAAHYLSGGQGSADNLVGKWVMEAVVKLLQERNANATSDADNNPPPPDDK